MIEIPEKLSDDILDRIASDYIGSIQTTGPENMDYVIYRFETTMMKLRAADDWRNQMYRVCVMLLSLYNQVDEEGYHLPDPARATIGAALHYVCKPFDVISDNIPGLGYVDDAHVLNLCLSHLEDICPEALKKARKQHAS